MTINCNGSLVDLSTPKVMGILNLTPDSFYDGGKLISEVSILRQVEKMLQEGATFIDLGGYSSRPGAVEVSETEELKRVLPAIKAILDRFPNAILSIDSFRSSIAKNCVEAGVAMVNDISAGEMDGLMMQTVAKLKVPYIMMHMQGTPQTMQKAPKYQNIIKDLSFYFSEKIATARNLGIKDLIIDPGFGFGKTIDNNYELLNGLNYFKHLETPILAGLSRKSMIYKVLESSPQEALNGTTSLHTVALLNGAKILRVHDVKEAVECIKLVKMLNR